MKKGTKGRLLLLVPSETAMESAAMCRAQPRPLSEQLTQSQRQLFQSFDLRLREQLGVGCLAAALRRNGYEVRVVDCAAERLDVFQAVEAISGYAPDWIGISISSPLQASDAELIIHLLSRMRFKAHVSVGGATAGANYRELLRKLPYVNSAVLGEGEATALELIGALERGGDWREARGVAFLENERIVYRPRPRHTDFESIPFPDRDSLEHFRRRGVDVPVLSVFSSRYCMQGCAECNDWPADMPARAKGFRYRPADDMRAELEMLVERFGARRFHYVDENFMGPETSSHVLEYAEQLMSRRLQVELSIECPAEDITREKTLALKRAGLRRVILNLTTAEQNKAEWQEINAKAIAICREAQLAFDPSMVLIGETTTPEEFREHGDFIRKHSLQECRQPLFLLNRLQFFPGARIEDALRYDVGEGMGSGDRQAPARCDHPLMDLIWKQLRPVCVQLYERSESQLPFMATGIWQMARQSSSEEGASYRQLFRNTRLWRTHIGELFLDWIGICLRAVEGRDRDMEAVEHELAEALKTAADGYDRRWLGVSFDQLVSDMRKQTPLA